MEIKDIKKLQNGSDVRGVALHEAHVSTFRYLQVAVFSGPDGIRRGRCTHAE